MLQRRATKVREAIERTVGIIRGNLWQRFQGGFMCYSAAAG